MSSDELFESENEVYAFETEYSDSGEESPPQKRAKYTRSAISIPGIKYFIRSLI